MVWGKQLLGQNAHEVTSEVHPSCHGDVSPETKLYRFLLHGSIDIPVGELEDLSTISDDRLNTLKNILSRVDLLKLMDTLSYFYEKGWTRIRPLPETIPFILALTSKTDLPRTCSLVQKILKTPEEFLLFIMHCVETSPFSMEEELKQTVQSFYASHDFDSLAKMVAEVPNQEGWSHGRVIKLGDFTSDHPDVQAIIKFAKEGPEKIKCMEDQGAKNLLKYLRAIEEFRKTSDSEDALLKIIDFQETFNKSTVMEDKNIIEALTERLDLKDVLIMFDVINGSISDGEREESGFEERILQIFSSLKSQDGPMNPCEWFLSEQRYWVNRGNRPIDLTAPNTVLDAIDVKRENSIKSLAKLDLSIRIVIQPCLFSTKSSGFIHGDKAAAMIASLLAETGRDVEIYSFDGSRPEKINYTELANITVASWITTPMNPKAMAKFVRESSTDLVVVIGTSFVQKELMNMVNNKKQFSKLVMCNLSDYPDKLTYDHNDILVSRGFHKDICDVITAFAILNFTKLHQPIVTKL